jgi:hypothetical protein
MPAACEFDALRVAATITAGATSDTVNITLLKNGVPAGSTTGNFNVSTLNTTVLATDTTHKFTVAAGDTVSIQLTQTTGVPTIRFSVTSRCRCGGGGTQPACN